MSIIEQIPSVTYKGNGTQTQFEFPFPILAEENLSVSIFNTIDKTTTELELGTDYDVVVKNNEYPAENGYIIYMYKPTGEGLPVGLNLTIDRAVPYEQQSVYPPNTLLNPEQIENDLDNLEMQIQQLNLKDGRLITIPPGYDGSTEDYLEEFWDAVQNGGEQALNAANRAEDAADRAEDAADEAEAWAKEQGLWEMDDNNDLFPIENTPITADDDWELDENGDIMPRGTVSNLQYPTHVRVVDVFSKLQGLNLKTGQLVMTQGFYEPADGGEASYVCVDEIGEDETADGYGIIALNNGKYLKLRVKDYVNVKWFGAYIDGEHDDSTSFNRAVKYLNSIYKSESLIIESLTGSDFDYNQTKYTAPALFIPSGIMKINNTLELMLEGIDYVFDNTLIDATSIQGTSMLFKGTTDVATGSNDGTLARLANFCLMGEIKEDNLAITFDSARVNRNITFENVQIIGFKRQILLTSHTFIINFINSTFGTSELCIDVDDNAIDLGERISFIGCSFGDNSSLIRCHNDKVSFFFTTCSLDYNKTLFDVYDAKIFIVNSHIEWRATEYLGKMSGKQAYVSIVNSQLFHTGLNSDNELIYVEGKGEYNQKRFALAHNKLINLNHFSYLLTDGLPILKGNVSEYVGGDYTGVCSFLTKQQKKIYIDKNTTYNGCTVNVSSDNSTLTLTTTATSFYCSFRKKINPISLYAFACLVKASITISNPIYLSLAWTNKQDIQETLLLQHEVINITDILNKSIDNAQKIFEVLATDKSDILDCSFISDIYARIVISSDNTPIGTILTFSRLELAEW